ncbi:hypothetical protein [Flavobacterium soyangense]|uniref:Uncharacterized protein n=1 Tax=Flavobacterium soyangense TaxID=2023265 RepID=A0A930Y0A0_9FLAO|nr:hypothetical protein [Flavobacterium soyangense]MBF2709743.1 hypothetical protein [Flavobacterium soyangense]
MNTKQQLAATLELFTPLFGGEQLVEDYSHYLQTVYFVEKDRMKLESHSGLSNKFEGKKNFPIGCEKFDNYFVAEFWFPYSAGTNEGNYFVLSHVFQLDLVQLSTAIEAIEKERPSVKAAFNKELAVGGNVAFLLQERPDFLKDFLLDHNHRRYDYQSLAQKFIGVKALLLEKVSGISLGINLR